MNEKNRPSEFELIARVFAPLSGEGGFGLLDDAAAYRPPPGHDLVLTCDAIAAGVHFFTADPWDKVAQKALRVNLSDLAAKGAKPEGYLLTLALPEEWDLVALTAFGAGLAHDQAAFSLPLWGGDTIHASGGLTVSITAIGSTPLGRMIRRAGAQPGDALVVTGTIGDAALGLKLRLDPSFAEKLGLSKSLTDFLLARYLLPEPRLGAIEALRCHAHAAMDLSDGLVGDIKKIAAASGVRIVIDAPRVPLSPAARAALNIDPTLLAPLLTGGDDYEIAVSLPQEDLADFLHRLAKHGIAATMIGTVEAGEGLVVIDEKGRPLQLETESYTHFR